MKVIDSHITTALNLTKSTKFTSGAAEITFSDVPQPVASSSGVPPSKRRRHSSESQEDVAEIGTCLGENQCSCGQFFEDKKSLDIHIKAVHLPSNWSCPHQSCSKFGHPYPNRYSLWKHIRTHHLNTWNYQCKEHNFRWEESGYYKKHLDEYHGITSDLRCPNAKPCNHKLFGTKAKLLAHVEICGKKQKTFACNICTKTFRSKRSLCDHIKLYKDGNIEEEVIIPCPWPGCTKTYKSRTAMVSYYKDKHKRSAMPARVEATSTTTSANQGQPALPASPAEN